MEAAATEVLDRLMSVPGIAAAAFFDPHGVCLAACGDDRTTTALVEGGRHLLELFPNDTSHGQLRDLPLAARRLRSGALIVVGARDVDLASGDAHFHISTAALALRAKSSRPPPMLVDEA